MPKKNKRKGNMTQVEGKRRGGGGGGGPHQCQVSHCVNPRFID